jgi:hypothetical protein
LEYTISTISNLDFNYAYTYNVSKLENDTYPLIFSKKVDIAPNKDIKIDKCNCCIYDGLDSSVPLRMISFKANCLKCCYAMYYKLNVNTKGHNIIIPLYRVETIAEYENQKTKIYNYYNTNNSEYMMICPNGTTQYPQIKLPIQPYKDLKELIKNPSEIQKIIDYASLLL